MIGDVLFTQGIVPAGYTAVECNDEKDIIKKPDGVYQPEHYTQWKGMEPFTFFMINNVPFPEASVCKYVLRWRKKDGLKDLRKAARIIEMMIELEENRADYTPIKGCL